MSSEDWSSTNEVLSDSEPIPKLQRRTVHPDSLKFMDMAKICSITIFDRQSRASSKTKTLMVGWAHPTTLMVFLEFAKCLALLDTCGHFYLGGAATSDLTLLNTQFTRVRHAAVAPDCYSRFPSRSNCTGNVMRPRGFFDELLEEECGSN